MNKQVSVTFLIFGVFFITCLLIANILAVKIIQIGPWAAPAGVLVFPISYIINDLITEVYGFKKACLIIWLGFAMNLLLVVFLSIGIKINPASFWTNQEAFSSVLGNTPRIVLASMTAYLAGSFLNAYVLSKMKRASKGENFSLRAIISTLVGEGADSLLFIAIAFGGVFGIQAILLMVLTQTVLKTAYEIVILPLTIMVVKFVKQHEDIDINDQEGFYNPFQIFKL